MQYKSKIVSLDIFILETSIVRNLHLPELGKKHLSYITDQYSFFGSDFGICVARNQRTFEDRDLIIEAKNICIDQ